MQKFLIRSLFLALLLSAAESWANETIATCGSPEGYAYYHHFGIWPKKESGFQDDSISKGITTLVKLRDNEYDLMFVDARGTIISNKRDGANIVHLRSGEADATFLVAHPGLSIELYTFYRDNDGDARFDLLGSKGGAMPFHKSSVMTGECSDLDLTLIR